MAEMANNYIAFLDLVGTKNFGENAGRHYENMEAFRRELGRIGDICLKDTDKIYMFSDCAYVWSDDIDCIAGFLAELRDVLLPRRIYFKAALVPTDKNWSEDSTAAEAVKPNPEMNRNLFGVKFGDVNIFEAYMRQERYKGIGIFVSDEAKKAIGPDRLAESVYYVENENFEKTGAGRWSLQKYTDLKAVVEDEDSNDYAMNVAQVVLDNYLSANTQSHKYSRHYIPLLTTMLRSYAVTKKKGAGEEELLAWDEKSGLFAGKAPWMFNTILKMARAARELDVLGLDILCLVVADIAFGRETAITPYDRKSIVKTLNSYACINNKYSRDIHSIPNVFLDGKRREEFIRLYKEILTDDNPLKKILKE